MPPTVYVIAGPNGVGKSTAAYWLIPAGVEQINPDDIARQFREQTPHQEVVLQLTNDEATRRIAAHRAKQESFGIETNLYDQPTWEFFLALQQTGYALEVIFLCTSQLTTLVERVRNRRQLGGHFVRPDVIRERYLNGLYWLNQYFDRPDALTLLDTADGLVPVYRRLAGEVQYQADPLPAWVQSHLSSWFGSLPDTPEPGVRDAESLDEVRRRYDLLKHRPPTQPD
jgi:predicted ABC-type ATPase